MRRSIYRQIVHHFHELDILTSNRKILKVLKAIATVRVEKSLQYILSIKFIIIQHARVTDG